MTRLEYDAADRVIGRTNGSGETIVYAFDAEDRLTLETGPSGMRSEYKYDALGNLVEAANESVSVKLERDFLGRVIKETQGDVQITWGLGRGDEILSTASSLGADFRFAYDGNGLASRIEIGSLGTLEIARNGQGQEISRNLPGDIHLDLEYDEAGRLARQSLRENPELSRAYRYNPFDQLVQLDDGPADRMEFGYDPSGNLAVYRRNGKTTRYGYDAAGNLTTHDSQSGQSLFEYPGNRITGGQCAGYRFDANGRLVGRSHPGCGEWKFEWDAKDTLRAATDPSGRRWEYRYDPFGRRIAKIGPEGEVRFVWDQDVLLHQINPDGSIETWGTDPHSFKPLLKVKGRELISVLHDQKGTPREMVDGKGRIVWAASLDPWGNVETSRGSLEDCPFRFQGQYYDAETGFHYNRFRYYDPRDGRFISQDPIRLAGGTNPYRYAPDPVNWIDPFGLCEEDGKQTTFRGERSSKKPDDVFKEGLKSKGDNMDLLRHTKGNQSDSGYLATSKDREIAEGFAGKNGYVYVINSDRGIDANKTLGASSPFPEQKEVAFPREIKPTEIVGAYPMQGGKPTGEFIPNPNYGGG
jgi:RHS repeat-associated protein